MNLPSIFLSLMFLSKSPDACEKKTLDRKMWGQKYTDTEKRNHLLQDQSAINLLPIFLSKSPYAR